MRTYSVHGAEAWGFRSPRTPTCSTAATSDVPVVEHLRTRGSCPCDPFDNRLCASVVSPVVVPPVAPPERSDRSNGHPSAGAKGRRALPLPRLADTRACSTAYGLATIDCHGRIADNMVIRALGWAPGTRLDIHENGGLGLVLADRQGVFSVTGQGHVRLPATVRHWCGLVPGDRVLLAGDPAQGLLVVHPPVAL